MSSKIKLPDGQEASNGDFIIVLSEDKVNNDENIEEIFEVNIHDDGRGGSITSVWIDEKEEKIRRLMYDDEISLVKDILSLEESGGTYIFARDDITIIEESLEDKYDADKFRFDVAGRTKVALQKIKQILLEN